MRPLTDLRVAVGFLTRVPVGDVSRGDPSSVRVESAVPWFPLVGAAIGLAHGAVWRALVEVLAPLPAAAIATGVALLITGAFHHDGLADMADAFGGGWTVEQRFEILKDSRLGTYGTASLALAVIIEVAVVADLSPNDGFWALIGAHAVARAAAVVTMVVAPTAGDGLGASYTRTLSKPFAIGGAAIGIGIAVAATVVGISAPAAVVWAVAGAVVATGAVVVLSIRKIGGFTGDVLGAITVVVTLAWLAATAAAL